MNESYNEMQNPRNFMQNNKPKQENKLKFDFKKIDYKIAFLIMLWIWILTIAYYTEYYKPENVAQRVYLENYKTYTTLKNTKSILETWKLPVIPKQK